MARPSRTARRKHLAARAMVRLERGYLRDLRKFNKRTAELLAPCRDGISIRLVLDQRRPALVELIKTWMKRVVFLFGPRVIEELNNAAKGHAALIEKKDAFDIFQESVLLWLDEYAFAQANSITGSMAEFATQVLVDAFNEGLGEQEAAQLLQEVIGGDYSNAARIVRTEIHTAANLASDEAARATGLDMVKEWGVTDDARARPTHVDADGQRREMDEPFSVGGYALMYPGDASGPAHEVINCRCVTLYHPRINGQVFD